MPIDRVPDRLRTFGCAFLYWLVFLLALEPGNILHAQRLGHVLAFDREALRIGMASLLGCSTAPWILALNHRYPLFDRERPSNSAVHIAAAATLAFVLIVVSCVLAAWILFGKAYPSMSEIRSQLAANWLLLTLVLGAFAALSQALNRARSPARERPRPNSDPIPVKSRGRLGYVDLASIDWIESQGNYLALHVGEQSHLIRDTLSAFSCRLDHTRFVRVHRRAIVAVDRIREIQPLANGDSQLILEHGHTIRASRSHRKALRERWAAARSPRSSDG